MVDSHRVKHRKFSGGVAEQPQGGVLKTFGSEAGVCVSFEMCSCIWKVTALGEWPGRQSCL